MQYDLAEKSGLKKQMADALNTQGISFWIRGDYPNALDYYQRSLKIKEEIGDKNGIANSLNNIGIIYQYQGDYPNALDYNQRSSNIYEEIGDKNGIASSLNNIGVIYKDPGDYPKAIKQCSEGLLQAQEIEAIDLQRDACECLYDAYKSTGNGNKALEYHEQMRALDDSLNAEETSKKLQQMEFQKEMLADSIAKAEEARLVQEAHQEEVRQEKQTRNWSIAGGVLFLVLAGGFYGHWRYVKKSRDTISQERDRSENLLLNILPAEIAQELKEKGRADARDFEMVSILFTDFKGFTEQSAKLSAADLVNEINHCFEAFDGIMEKYGIEKIKTIGDAYMAAGGLPVPTDESVKNTVLAALEMHAFISKRKTEMDAAEKPSFEMRVGIHTGPVVAGIVGVKKFQYDIWGDTVNTASRIESAGEVGKVNISQATYELLKNDSEFTFESRGKIEAKGKGEMEMWFVSVHS
jgi:class 3 adenylate cyclase